MAPKISTISRVDNTTFVFYLIFSDKFQSGKRQVSSFFVWLKGEAADKANKTLHLKTTN